MTFLYCLISFVAGMVAMAGFFMAALFNGEGRSPESVVKTMQKISREAINEKGAIMYPKSFEQDAMEEMFERNDKNGEDTKIGEIEADGD